MSFTSSGLFWYSLSLHKSVHFNHWENNSSQRHDKTERLHLHDRNCRTTDFGLDSRPSTQPAARWLSPLLLLSRHHPEPTGMGTSVGTQYKLRCQICGDSFPFDSASSGSQHKAGTGWTLGHLVSQLNDIFRLSSNRSK